MSHNRQGPRAFLHRLHTTAGVFVAPFLLFAAITGLAYSMGPAAEKIIYHDEMTATSDAPAQPIDMQVEAARGLHPDLDVTAVQVAEDGDTTTRVLFADDSLLSSSYRHVVFVDPGDLSVKGDSIQYGSAASLPLRAWIIEGHRRLWSGNNIGRLYSETAASWLGALTIAGLWLWWDRSRRGRTKGTTARASHMRKHARLGAVLGIGFLFLTVSGLTWSWVAGAQIKDVRTELNWLAPTPSVASEPADYYNWGQAQRVIDTARAEGLERTIEVTPPIMSSEWTAREVRQEWRNSIDMVAVDGETGKVVDEIRFADWPLAAKASEWIVTGHMGILFGWVNQIILAIVALGLITMIVRGYLMWWLRGKGNRPGRLPAPTRWRDLSRGTIIALVIMVVGYSLIAPLFGITLVAFVLFDWLFRKVGQRT